jgi:hypothetical protein
VSLKGYRGSVRKSATVFSNDPKTPRINLLLQGTVRALIEVNPSNVVVLRGMVDRIAEQTIDLTSSMKPFHIARIESSLGPKISYRLETVEEGRHYRLIVANQEKKGRYSGALRVHTDMPEKPEIPITVSGLIEGELSLRPQAVLVGRLNPQQPIRTGQVLIINNRKKPFQISQMTYDRNLLLVTSKPLVNEVGYSLEITPKMESISGGERKEIPITVQTDVDTQEELQIQVRLVNITDI